MKKTSIFEYKNYKQFIIDWMELTPMQGRGQRKLLAEAIGCQTPFITHVLSGDYHFSPEQAEACARYLELNDNETEFFLLLVFKQRSGTKSLEMFFNKQISKMCEQHTIIKKRLKIDETISFENQMIYYSSWQYATIHIALLIPELQNIQSLTKYFNLPANRLLSILQFLEENGFIEKKGNLYKVKKPVLHLEKDSPYLINHLTNWRLKAIENIALNRPEDLHYSGIMSLSKDDYEWIREKLVNLLEELVIRLKDSNDEKLAHISFDLFQV